MIVALPNCNSIRLYNATNGFLLRKFSTQVCSVVALSPDGQYVVHTDEANTYTVRSVSTGEILRRVSNHTAAIRALSFSPDGKYIISVGEDAFIRISNLSDGALVKSMSINIGNIASISGMVVSPLGTYVGVLTNGRVHLWNIATNTKLPQIYSARGVSFSNDEKWLAYEEVLSNSRVVRVVDIQTGVLSQELPIKTQGQILNLTFTKDDKSLVVVSQGEVEVLKRN